MENPNAIVRDEWPNMTINQLIQQKNILMDKYMFLAEQEYKWAGNLLKGIEEIDALILTKNY